MIDLSDFSKDDIVKVLVVDDDEVEEECYARACSINEGKLYVKYLEQRNKFFKSAPMYSFDVQESEVDPESLLEHFKDVDDPEETGIFIGVEDGYWVKEDEIDSECSDSDVEDYSSEENNSFVEEDDVNEWQKPPDHALVDSDWNKWVPKSSGERHFKNMVDRVEHFAKLHEDELKFLREK